jgi:DNA topoisomerase IB
MTLIFERVGNIIYAREFGSHPSTRWVYKEL